jgi:hypothetical protein
MPRFRGHAPGATIYPLVGDRPGHPRGVPLPPFRGPALGQPFTRWWAAVLGTHEGCPYFGAAELWAFLFFRSSICWSA